MSFENQIIRSDSDMHNDNPFAETNLPKSPALLTPSSIIVAKERIANLLQKDFANTESLTISEFSTYLSEEALIDPEIRRAIIDELETVICSYNTKISNKPIQISTIIDSLSLAITFHHPLSLSSSSSSTASSSAANTTNTNNISHESTDSCIIEYCLIRVNEIAYTGSIIDRHMEYNVSVSSSINLLDQFNPSFTFEILSNVVRRYSDLFFLREMILLKYAYRFVPLLPPKAFIIPVSMEHRREGIENFLFILANHPVLRGDPLVRSFFTEQDFQLVRRLSRRSDLVGGFDGNVFDVNVCRSGASDGSNDKNDNNDNDNDNIISTKITTTTTTIHTNIVRKAEKFVEENTETFTKIRDSVIKVKGSLENFSFSLADTPLSTSLGALVGKEDTSFSCLHKLPNDLSKVDRIIVEYSSGPLVDLVRNLDYIIMLLHASAAAIQRVKRDLFGSFGKIERQILQTKRTLDEERLKSRIAPPLEAEENVFLPEITSLEMKLLELQRTLLLHSKGNASKTNKLQMEMEWLTQEVRKCLPLINLVLRVEMGQCLNKVCDQF